MVNALKIKFNNLWRYRPKTQATSKVEAKFWFDLGAKSVQEVQTDLDKEYDERSKAMQTLRP